jgi:hypothetical protein
MDGRPSPLPKKNQRDGTFMRSHAFAAAESVFCFFFCTDPIIFMQIQLGLHGKTAKKALQCWKVEESRLLGWLFEEMVPTAYTIAARSAQEIIREWKAVVRAAEFQHPHAKKSSMKACKKSFFLNN